MVRNVLYLAIGAVILAGCVSVENLSQGFTHCFVVTFLSEADRAKCLPHPAHKEFASSLGPYLDKVLVVDYWTK